jgi:protein-L-isoaspartate(D-aspartate) O-methyltransferase
VTTTERLAAELAGKIPAVWVDVVSVVDRAKFIPARVWVYDEGNVPQPLDRDTDPRRWWQVVSSDTAIMTQFDNGATVWPDATREHPTSSASQPSLMLNMLTALDVHQGHQVLEIGTGTGYQTAILAELAREIVTIERLPELGRAAHELLLDLGYSNIEFRIGDGSLGCPERAPYDAILVTAGAPDYPAPLYRQLQVGGRLVIPVGDETAQTLRVVTRGEQGPQIREAGGCRFVRLIGDAAWPEV